MEREDWCGARASVAGDEQVNDAGAQIETVEDDVHGDHDGDEAEPDGFHRFSLLA